MIKKLALWAECMALCGLGPFGLYYFMLTPAGEIPIDLGGFEPRRFLFPLLWAFALWAIYSWKKRYAGQRVFKRIRWDEVKRRVLPRFAFSVVFMLGVIWLLDEPRMFGLIAERPKIWVMVMILYPLISVIPQEVLFRLFFFDRYRSIFGENWGVIIASGLAFGHAHLIFNNPIAYLMSIAGGVLFATTYARTKNLSLVWLEHVIYGQCVFTVGLGWYFYTGAAMSHGG